MDKDLEFLLTTVFDKYARIRREILAYTQALTIIGSQIPKSEFIMPLGVRVKELLAEVQEIASEIERRHGLPTDPDLIRLRAEFRDYNIAITQRIDSLIKAAESC